MLMPKRVKFRRVQRGRLKGKTKAAFIIAFPMPGVWVILSKVQR